MKTSLTVTLLGSCAFGLAACTLSESGAKPSGDGTSGGALDWQGCGTTANGRDILCTGVEVPVDYDDPHGPQLSLAINRVMADRSVPYQGILFYNPGGPGGSGKDAVASLAQTNYFDAYAPGYDVIGFDPRGVGESGERGCGLVSSAPMQASEMAPVEISTADYVEAVAYLGRQCAITWGGLFQNLGSNQVVKDMDRLRQALGQAKLNYLGVSYGTRLGALYAHDYPESTGFLVLDSSMTPDADWVSVARTQFAQTLALQDLFFEDCDAGVLTCPADARALFDDMLAAANELGVRDEIASHWSDALAFPETRDALPQLLEQQASEVDSNWLLDVAAQPSIFGVGLVANLSVTCADATKDPPSVEAVDALHAEFQAQSDVFAYQARWTAVCTGWPVTRDPVPLPSALDGPPLLVLAGTKDLLTPLSEGQAMTAALGNATLLTSNHYGHSATSYGGDCVVQAVRTFFTEGVLPEAGATCN